MVKLIDNWASFNDYSDENRRIPIIPCLRCGVCCTKYNVHVTFLDGHRIADGLGITWKEFEDNYLDTHWPETSSFFLKRVDGACIFLQPGNQTEKASCLIHKFRPEACREWMPSLYRKLCQTAFFQQWGLTISQNELLEGPNERLKDFLTFLDSANSQEN